MSKILSWGQCDIFVRQYNGTSKGSTWLKFDTPVEGSTSLETSEGDKTEAKVEGGENEAVRHAKSTYALKWEERIGAGHTDTVEDLDGIIAGEFEVLLFPTENPTAPALYIPVADGSATDSYTSADGTKKAYTFDAVKNSVKVGATGAKKDLGQVAWGSATLDGTTGLPTAFYAFKDPQTTKENLLGE